MASDDFRGDGVAVVSAFLGEGVTVVSAFLGEVTVGSGLRGEVMDSVDSLSFLALLFRFETGSESFFPTSAKASPVAP